jgi:3-hydroxyisobutyrate dehydrogenase-like beta-hydroxyacid dehydrogenase
MKTGFIGLGNVGAKLAASLLRNGFDLMVRDVETDDEPEAADVEVKPGQACQEI